MLLVHPYSVLYAASKFSKVLMHPRNVGLVTSLSRRHQAH